LFFDYRMMMYYCLLAAASGHAMLDRKSVQEERGVRIFSVCSKCVTQSKYRRTPIIRTLVIRIGLTLPVNIFLL